MKKYINIFMALVLAFSLASCSKEDPFGPWSDGETGRVLKSALAAELTNAEGFPAVFNRGTRAETPTADDFTVDFIKDGDDAPYASYLYAEMPEVVTLPVGSYKAVAHFGANSSAAWDEPYFEGDTSFDVEADKITEVVDPIVARLSNVRVSIKFSPSLKANMSNDSRVVVKVGDVGSLEFSAADEERSAYFAYVPDSNTLTATFSGAVENYPIVESKVYDNVQPGNHYSITFRLHDVADDEVGSVNSTLTVDASVEVVDLTRELDPDFEDDILEDDLRPIEGNPDVNPGEDPVNPEMPSAPVVTAIAPEGDFAGMVKTDFSKVNNTNNLYCAFRVVSTAEGGIQGLKVVIESESLNEDALDEVGLAKNLDLVNPGDKAEALAGLGFPTYVGGRSSVDFDITSFMPMLAALGSGDHQFVITVTDANGTTETILRLHVD